jgi:hypothetical protein
VGALLGYAGYGGSMGTSAVNDWLRSVLGPLDGSRIPGGCDDCDAYQTAHPVAPGIWTIRVHHDHWCPFLRELEARRAT